MSTYLDESVDSQDDKLRLSLCVVHQIEVNQFLLFQIFRLLDMSLCLCHYVMTYHILDDIGEETATILSDCVVSNDSLDCVCSFLSVLRVELLTEFPILP